MIPLARILLVALVVVWLVAPSVSRAQQAQYVDEYKDPAIEEMKAAEAERQSEADKATREVRDRQKKERDAKTKQEFQMVVGVIEEPASPSAFQSAFHFPPVSQDRTGGCWCFTGISYFESEVFRKTGQKIRLSEMFVIYHEYLEKARRFVQERGESRFSLGSEVNAGQRMMKLYGMVPLDAYPGRVGTDRYEHTPLFNELEAYLDMVRETGLWDEAKVLASVRIILDKYLGAPPETLEFNGTQITPKEYLHDVLKIDPDEYCVTVSTLSAPFYTRTVFDVPDNWWRSDDYYNLPLDEWYDIIRTALDDGYTVGICGDVSEPGYVGESDVAVVPDFDIPPDRIDQNARELRIFNGATTDDHCVHIVGRTWLGDHDWFLIKDSSRSPHPGQFWGYMFYRDDYVKLKMLSYIVHEDAMKDVLAKFK